MRMRTALAAALLCSGALLGSVGTAVADDGPTGVEGTGNQVIQDGDDFDSFGWGFGHSGHGHGGHGHGGHGDGGFGDGGFGR